MKALVKELELPATSPRPRTDRDYARVLIKSQLPDEPDDVVESILDQHRSGASEKDVWGTCLSPGCSKEIDGILDKDEAAEVRGKLAKVAAQASAAKASSSSSSSSTVPKGRQPTRLKNIPFSGEVSKEEATRLLPKVAGCNLTLDRKRHMRWVCSYPREQSPFSKSAVWNEERSSRDALLCVVRWAWNSHTEATGERCPWNLDRLAETSLSVSASGRRRRAV